MLAAITTMFCGNTAQVVASWVIMDISVSTVKQTKAEIFIYAVTSAGDGWDALLNAISMMFITPVADGLLVNSKSHTLHMSFIHYDFNRYGAVTMSGVNLFALYQFL